jgi:hypothetical protein
MNSSALIREVKASLTSRGFSYSADKVTCLIEFDKKVAEKSWDVGKKRYKMVDFRRYLESIFDQIEAAKEAERIETERVADEMNKKLLDLSLLNECLRVFGEPEQATLKRARKVLKTKVFIGIYDLVYERYHLRHATHGDLVKYLRADKTRIFPLSALDKNPCQKNVLRAFLHRVYSKARK